jgi:hypothetical protein
MKELSEVEKHFVMEVLDTHGEYVVDLLQDAINEHGLRITDKLIDSLDYRVERRDNDFVLQISFLGYGRAIEIQYFKSKRLRREARERNESAQLRRAKKKDTRFYARTVYGTINRLLGRMASEYTDAEIERIKGFLSMRTTGS